MTWEWLYPTSVSIIFILIGWRVLFNNAKKLTTRNETHTISTRLVSLLNDIQKLSEDFWLKSQFVDQPQYYDLLMLSKIKQISSKLEILRNRNIPTDELQKLIFPLRKACTYNSYQINSLNEKEKRLQVEHILNATSTIETKIDKKMTDIFPPNY